MSDPNRRPILAPFCPRCGHPPVILLGGGHQAFCGDEDCVVFTWDPTESAETFEANARPVRFIDNAATGEAPPPARGDASDAP